MPVDRCVCLNLTFTSLLETARSRSLTVDQLRAVTGCGGGCGLCVPYLRLVLGTGQTSLPVMPPEGHRIAGRSPGPPSDSAHGRS
ncbi:MAG: (2Fe-2S)-binding protein [Phycisphaeraceae bacterium]|nr:(2Fe-2S)-binding protein [Phycisphaerae bacterium]MBX3392917.1 (2Fe-2S)-binding protein [Phycisphaeraceae bacterium]